MGVDTHGEREAQADNGDLEAEPQRGSGVGLWSGDQRRNPLKPFKLSYVQRKRAGAREHFFNKGPRLKINVRQVVIAVTLTHVRHKRHMQFLTSDRNFSEVAEPYRPFRASESNISYYSSYFSNWRVNLQMRLPRSCENSIGNSLIDNL